MTSEIMDLEYYRIKYAGMYWLVERKGCEGLRGHRVPIDRINIEIEEGALPDGRRDLYRVYFPKDAHGGDGAVPGEVINTARNLDEARRKEVAAARSTLGITEEEIKEGGEKEEKKEEVKKSFFRF